MHSHAASGPLQRTWKTRSSYTEWAVLVSVKGSSMQMQRHWDRWLYGEAFFATNARPVFLPMRTLMASLSKLKLHNLAQNRGIKFALALAIENSLEALCIVL